MTGDLKQKIADKHSYVLPHNFHSSVLREYDIRGVIDKTLSVHDAYALGQGFGILLRRQKPNQDQYSACIGYDGRLSSPSLAEALAQGFMDAGIDVTDIGMGPTPLLYYAGFETKADVAVMITGSHNPSDQNGFKMMLDRKPFYGQQIQDLAKLVGESYQPSTDVVSGQYQKKDFKKDYIGRILKPLQAIQEKPLKVAWDPGNGAAGAILPELIQQLPGEHILINGEVDGSFPNHHPDPSEPENMHQLVDVIKAEGCDLGIAFDGDGDRIGAVDHTGQILAGDQMLVVWAEQVLEKHPGVTIITDVKASQSLFDELERLGASGLMWACGHSKIKVKMAEEKSLLAGETSGHTFFADDYYGFDDAIYASVKLLEWVISSKMTLHERLATLPQFYVTPEVRVECDEVEKFAIVDRVKQRQIKAGHDVIAVDGVRVTTEDGWWLMRASNTQAVLSLRAEGRTQEGLKRLVQAVARELEAEKTPINTWLNTCS